MHKIIETIHTNHGVPIGSAVQAAQYLGGAGRGSALGKADYIRMLKDVTGKELSYENEDMYRMVYGYFVTEAINELNHTDVLDASKLLETAEVKAERLITNDPWMFAKPEAEPKLDDDGKPKPKKGAKKDLAKKVYVEQIEGKVTKRKDAIEILVKEVGLTPAGASTYYANLKKGVL